MIMMKQIHSSISLSLILLSLFHSTTLAAVSPAAAPVSQPRPTPPAAAPAAPLVPTLPQPPSDNTPDNPSPSVDIVGILRNAKSFNIFLRLMKTTQLINQLNSQLITIKSGGLTILAPEDSAFSELKPGFLNSLSDGQKLELLQFHVLPDYVPASNFDTLTNPVRTLAGNKLGKAELNVISYGGSVNISTGVVNTTINGIIYTDKHLAIYKVGKVLLPSEFFATKNKTIAAVPSLAPGPAVEAAKAPKADKQKPAPLDDSSTSSQVVPTQTSSAVTVSVTGTWVASVLAGVFGAVFTI